LEINPSGAGPEAPVPAPKPPPPFRRGRHETRTCCVITNPSAIRDISLWTKLTAICMVVSQRVIDGVSSSEIRYFIGSAAQTAKGYLQWVRGHWGIETSLHWVLDVCWLKYRKCRAGRRVRTLGTISLEHRGGRGGLAASEQRHGTTDPRGRAPGAPQLGVAAPAHPARYRTCSDAR